MQVHQRGRGPSLLHPTDRGLPGVGDAVVHYPKHRFAEAYGSVVITILINSENATIPVLGATWPINLAWCTS